MANKHMKRYSTSSGIQEIQTKRIMTYHYTTIGMAKIWNAYSTKCWQGCGATGSLRCCWWESKMILWEGVCWFLTKLSIPLPYNSATAFIAIYPWSEIYIHTEMYVWIFTAVLFIAAQTWNNQDALQLVSE